MHRVCFGLALLVGSALGFVIGSGVAGAAPTASADISGGTLTISAPGSFAWNDTLSGSNQTVVAPMTVTVIDATGSGAGWTTDASMTPLRDTTTGAALTGTVHVNGSATSGTATTGPAAVCGANSTCRLPTPSASPVTYPHIIPEGTPAPTANAFATAAAASGMGTIKLPLNAWLHIKADTYAGTYTATVTISVVSGP